MSDSGVQDPASPVQEDGPNQSEEVLIDLKKHLLATAPALLSGDAELFERALHTPETGESLQIFVSDPMSFALIVRKWLRGGAENHEEEQQQQQQQQQHFFTFHPFELQSKSMQARGGLSEAVAYIKTSSSLVASATVSSQLNVCQINEHMPFETMLGYVRHCFLPFTRSLMASESDDGDEHGEGIAKKKAGGPGMDLAVIQGVSKKLGELEVELLRSQQSVEIPHITLDVHKSVADFVKRQLSAGSPLNVDDMRDAGDAQFLNELQAGLNEWKKAILRVTRLTRDVSQGTTMHEVQFWLAMERAIHHIYDQRESDAVELTFQILKQNKRFHATTGFMMDVGLCNDGREKDRVHRFSDFLRDLPLKRMLAAADLKDIVPAVESIFTHLKLIRRIEYPLSRAISLLHTLSRDLVAQMQSVLSSHRFMTLGYDEFNACVQHCDDIYSAWNSNLDAFCNELRDLKHRRKNESTAKINDSYVEFLALHTRIDEVKKVRKQHFELKSVITATMAQDPLVRSSTLKQISAAYAHLRECDVLDMGVDGEDMWRSSLAEYRQKVDRVEAELEEKIRELLGNAKDANEMFRVCAKFNKLFVRPRIQGAIREYQKQLMETVKTDILVLQEKFKTKYSRSEARRMSHLRDLPPVSGHIIWAKQIGRQLDTYMNRVEDVLGEKWHHHVEGKRLKQESDRFRQRLEPVRIWQAWLGETQALKAFENHEYVFKVVTKQQKPTLHVNFEEGMVTLFKEVRNLKRLGLKLPYELTITADETKKIYPYAVRLQEVMRVYNRTCALLHEQKDGGKGNGPASTAMLAAGAQRKLQGSIKSGMRKTWDMNDLRRYVDKLGTEATEFQDHVDELLLWEKKGEEALRQLGTCEPAKEAMALALGAVQAVIDHLDKRGYSNVSAWVSVLDKRVEGILVGRLEDILRGWVAAMAHDAPSEEADGLVTIESKIEEKGDDEKDEYADGHDEDGGQHKGVDSEAARLASFRCPSISHKIHIRNRVLQVSPPLEQARLRLGQHLSGWLGVVCELPRLRSFWDVEQAKQDAKKAATAGRRERRRKGELSVPTFSSVLEKVAPATLKAAHDLAQKRVSDATRYADTWLHYQALWDMDIDAVCASLGNDLLQWERVLVDMKKSRATFDNSESVRRFGPIEVQYGAVQTMVNNKYDAWHRDIISRFGRLLGELQAALFGALEQARAQLEQHSLQLGGSTDDIVNSLTLLQTLNDKAQKWAVDVKTHASVEALLQRQRHQFPQDWLYSDRVAGEWAACEQLLLRKNAMLQEQAPAIRSRIVSEDEALNDRVKAFVAEWKATRPVQGDLLHTAVENALGLAETTLAQLEKDVERVSQAKAALDLPPKDERRLAPVRKELQGLQDVWAHLRPVWEALETMKEKPFKEVQTTPLRKSLAALQRKMADMPPHMHSYDAFDYLRQHLKKRLEVNHSVGQLNSDVLRAKHHKELMKLLDLPGGSWLALTLGQVWSCDVRSHNAAVRHVLEQAQGEAALEDFLAEMASTFQRSRLELVDYRSKCFLVKNFDGLIEQTDSALSDLQAMKQSPFFSAFKGETALWEAKLNHAQAIFDVFIDVQRRWVYLEGIFNGNVDVQTQLAYQFKKFRTFDLDFVRLMREIKREDKVDAWVKEEKGLLSQLEDYSDMLNGIQRALGEYLEQQRAQFPRFYFVGDEDLLEIIGNAKNPVKIVRHLQKMFAGIQSLRLSEDKQTLLAMLSKEGEEVAFSQPVVLAEHPGIHAWLGQLELQMRTTLATLLETAMDGASAWRDNSDSTDVQPFFAWVDAFPAQIALLATQVLWSQAVEDALSKGGQGLPSVLHGVEALLQVLADGILLPGLPGDRRKKYEQLITELVHQRDVTRELIKDGVSSEQAFAWLAQARFYFDQRKGADLMTRLQIRISRATFYYGFEYLGVSERLVQTPLTDRMYLTMAEALHMRMGGNPYGPAGTGKTETVKALGAMLGRFVLVFNCDEHFDFQAMGRIFVGLCQVGAWGCFDEFNRLEERILSAVSQQIQSIQIGLKQNSPSIKLIGKPVQLNPRVGLFVTMNPGYAGRSNLPDNLKQLFRGVAMIKPDRRLIGQVMLFSQGFKCAERVSPKIVLLFGLCKDQLSDQPHYDFGLRALKSVLRSAGRLKRRLLQERKQKEKSQADDDDEKKQESDDEEEDEQVDEAREVKTLVASICSTVVPKLVSRDVALFGTLLSAVFPGAEVGAPHFENIKTELLRMCPERHLVPQGQWIDKVMQLHEILSIHHGVIMVGPSGTGKTATWTALMEVLEHTTQRKHESYVIDPKTLSKEELYGRLDPTTLEWTDGVFTHILRKIIDNVRGESHKTHWIVFDGDVDPEWAENLNSLLDDNKLLTLPNGERLALSDNIRILFETQSLRHATPATVSRCGMVWFSHGSVSTGMLQQHLLSKLRDGPINGVSNSVQARWKDLQQVCASALQPFFGGSEDGETQDNGEGYDATGALVSRSLEWLEVQDHIMDFSRIHALSALFSLLRGGVAKLIDYNENNSDFPLNDAQLKQFMSKFLIYALLWGCGGSLSLKNRLRFCAELRALATVPLPPASDGEDLIDWEVEPETQEWARWANKVGALDLESHKMTRSDTVVETVDTLRHTDVIGAWVSDHKPLIMCGPPGSGKSMTLTSVLRALPGFELVTLNFSSTTDPQLILRTLAHHCKTERTSGGGVVMRPVIKNKWLVVFCDEINLPATDKYDTQHVITFLRQITEQGGFWRASDLSWVELERVQFIGACNPPTDAGRVPLTPRFLRHCPLLFVDYPAPSSLRQIYSTFTRSLLKLVPSLRSHGDALTEAMIEVYTLSQQRFTPDQQPHYIYSPRELTRWVRAMYEAVAPMQGDLTLDGLVRLFVHEALRLFQDRLVTAEEREWTDLTVDEVTRKHFPSADLASVLQRPVLFSSWLSKQYTSVEQEDLREHVVQRLRVFYEEELDVKLVVFDEVLEHILRIDRVLRQPLGHLLLVGASGAGKTILSKFVSWMNGMSVFQIKVHKKYGSEDFDRDLREVLTRAGCHDEKICFIFDESNVLNTAFLERMNALLAGGEVPGLFEGADFTNLMHECREACRRDNVIIDNEEELYQRFIKCVQYNLHVVFTMNPANEDFDNRSATSPALFNRCVIDWFGEWSSKALYQVGQEFTNKMDLGDLVDASKRKDGSTEREAVVQTLVYVHESVHTAMERRAKSTTARRTYVTPRHYLDLIQHYKSIYAEKRGQIADQQLHLNTGLRKLRETQEQVLKLREALNIKGVELKDKEKLANEKLEQMMVDKAKAEEKRDASEQIAKEMALKAVEIEKRRGVVEGDLAAAKPALEEAEASVRGIKKSHLDTVIRFPNPPAAVKLALEPVLLMLGENPGDWKEIRRVLRRNDFIKSVLGFDADHLDEKLRKRISDKYLSDPMFTFEAVYRASKACGPLVKWVRSTINYARIKNSVEPLENEMKSLSAKQAELQRQRDELEVIRQELDERIQRYKKEYSALIGEAERIKGEMLSVKGKVDRSVALLDNLQSERARWEADSDGFQAQIATSVGDSLLASAFLAYIGIFNQHERRNLLEQWGDYLRDRRVETKDDLSLVEYLSVPSERLKWHANSLPDDELCVENAIMLKRFNRYPLIIDPSGQATKFLMEQYAERKIIRTSFLDNSFMKNLESALRFGNALLVEDVENIDPVLNSVLNREITRTGGRVMITLGDREIDFSPSFTIFLSTRDPSCSFTPDLCSRVTLVNFTVTPASLTSQCLSRVLKAERPDIDARRGDQLKLQGEFRVRLRSLEEGLLDALSSVQGNILDNEDVMTSLETLKKDAADITQKMSQSEGVMEEILTVSNTYRPFAVACASVYFTLEQLASVNFLYQFSLPSFLRLVNSIVVDNSSPQLAALKDPRKRLERLTSEMFSAAFTRVGHALLQKDQLPFALRLAQVALDDSTQADPSAPDRSLDHAELALLLRSEMAGAAEGSAAAQRVSVPKDLGLNAAQEASLCALCTLPGCSKLEQHLQANVPAWAAFLDTTNHLEGAAKAADGAGEEKDDSTAPTGWEQEGSDGTRKLFQQLLVAKALRPDRVGHAAERLVSSVFGEDFLWQVENPSLADVLDSEAEPRGGAASPPILLACRPGYDASGRVDELAADRGKQLGSNYHTFAMGSPEGYEQAEQAITKASKRGTWVLLKNVHLSPTWLARLEKKLHRLSAHPNFRLFMTMEISPKVPSSLLRLASVLICEPAVGIKSSLQRSFASVSPARTDQAPKERPRLYFLLAWLHAVVLERLRFSPVGWTKTFEFSETDLRCALDAVDEWVERAAQGRANLRPDEIPWDALRSLVKDTVYGGRIDNEFDQAALDATVATLFRPEAFSGDFALCRSHADGGKPLLQLPSCHTHKDFSAWIGQMTHSSSPEMLGLPHNAELLLQVARGREVCRHLALLQDDDTVAAAAAASGAERGGHERRMSLSGHMGSNGSMQPLPWMLHLIDSCQGWLGNLPDNKQLKDKPLHLWQPLGDAKTHEALLETLLLHPLFRCVQREHTYLSHLVGDVRADLDAVVAVLRGLAKGSNRTRAIIKALRRDQLPKLWGTDRGGARQWVTTLQRRAGQMLAVCSLKPEEYGAKPLWLGGFISPEAYVAATRQAVAQEHGWGLDQLELHVDVGVGDGKQSCEPLPDSFIFLGVVLRGAGWHNGELAISAADGLCTELSSMRLMWKRKGDNAASSDRSSTHLKTPVYLDDSRRKYLFTVLLPRPSGLDESAWSQRGVCLTVFNTNTDI